MEENFKELNLNFNRLTRNDETVSLHGASANVKTYKKDDQFFISVITYYGHQVFTILNIPHLDTYIAEDENQEKWQFIFRGSPAITDVLQMNTAKNPILRYFNEVSI